MKFLKLLLLFFVVISCLYSCKMDPEALNSNLVQAVMSMKKDRVKRYLEKGADPNTVLQDGETTVLDMALYKNEQDIFIMLAEAGADIKATDSDGTPALTRAAASNLTEVISYCIEHGADVNALDADKSTALHHAALKGSYEAVVKLVEAKADLSIPDANGDTPLKIAKAQENNKIVDYLKEHGAK